MDRLEWIVDVRTQRGYRDVLATIQGSTPTEQRELIRAQFTEDPTKHPVRVLVATDSAGEGIDLQDHCHRLVNFDIPFNPSRLEQRIGRIDRYGQRNTPQIYRFVPESADSQYARDLRFLVERIADKIGTVAADLGSVNQVVDFEVRNHFDPATGGRKAKSAAPDDGNAVITRALAGGLELNRRLTELSRTYDEHKVEMHLTPANARRVVDAALALTAQPPLLEDFSFAQDTDAAVFAVPGLGSAWQPALRGLDTRLEPDTLRPITFDDKAGADRGHASAQLSHQPGVRSADGGHDAEFGGARGRRLFRRVDKPRDVQPGRANRRRELPGLRAEVAVLRAATGLDRYDALHLDLRTTPAQPHLMRQLQQLRHGIVRQAQNRGDLMFGEAGTAGQNLIAGEFDDFVDNRVGH